MITIPLMILLNILPMAAPSTTIGWSANPTIALVCRSMLKRLSLVCPIKVNHDGPETAVNDELAELNRNTPTRVTMTKKRGGENPASNVG